MGGSRKQRGDVELWQVQTLLAGYHRLRVLMGVGCLQARKPSKPSPRSRPDSDLTQVWHGKQMETASFHTVIRDHRSSIGGCPLIHSSDDVDREANPVDLCDDISGSPSQLLCSPAQTGSPMFEYCDWGISQNRFQDLQDLLTLSQCFSMFLTSWFSWCFMMFLSVSPFGAFALFSQSPDISSRSPSAPSLTCEGGKRRKSRRTAWPAKRLTSSRLTVKTRKMLSKLNQNESCIDLIWSNTYIII